MLGLGKIPAGSFELGYFGRSAGDWMLSRLPRDCGVSADGEFFELRFTYGQANCLCFVRKALPLFSPERAEALAVQARQAGYDGICTPELCVVDLCGRDAEELSRLLLAEHSAERLALRLLAVTEESFTPAEEVRRAEELLRREIVARHREAGAVIYAEQSQYIEADVQIAKGCVIYPNSCLRGKTVIGENTVLYSNSLISDSRIAAGCTVYPGNVLEGCRIGEGCTLYPNNFLRGFEVDCGSELTAVVAKDARMGRGCTGGPYAYLRPGSQVSDRCRVGDFVELKNATLGEDTKVSHLTYVGDATVGRACNVGCGVVFANYDGKRKPRTEVGDECFIRSNCNLVAPVRLDNGCYIAAGTTVTQDVAAEDFVIGRVRQQVLPKLKGRYRRLKNGKD